MGLHYVRRPMRKITNNNTKMLNKIQRSFSSELRVAFTIIYEGRHHLEHKGFAENMLKMFDHWIVVEGYALPYGSTRWCKRLNVPAVSTDGTGHYLQKLSEKHENLHYYSLGRYYNGKDHQVNVAIDILTEIMEAKYNEKKCWLWEVDADEHWRLEDLEKAEQIALTMDNIGFSFTFNQYVGEGLVAKGDWGSGALNRLWKWTGQYFKSHEPALLEGQKRCDVIPDVHFEHYSYYFDKDVKFKSQYYSGHENVYKNLNKIRTAKEYPVHISEFFGKNTQIGKSNSYIYKI